MDGFTKTSEGYEKRISDTTRMFIPDMCVRSFDNGVVEMYKPDYAAIEAAKAPAVNAEKPGEYSYYYEVEQAPTGCDFEASLSHYGSHYYLRPLHDLPRLKGRGIKYDEQYNTYCVTEKAYEKIKAAYKIKFEMCFD